MYGCRVTIPPDTETLLLNVSVTLPVPEAAADNTTLVYEPNVKTRPVVELTIVVMAEPPFVADNVNVVA